MTEPLKISLAMGAREWVLLVVLSVLWGGSFFFVEVALAEMPPLSIVFCRVGIAAIVLVIVAEASGQPMFRRHRPWGAFFAMGALNNLVPFALIVWGQVHITGGLASILNATTPVFAVVLAHLLTADEKLTIGRFAGVVLGTVGVVVMIGPGALAGLGHGGLGMDSLAQLAILGAAVSYALAGIFGRRFAAQPPLVTASGQVTASTVLMVPLVFAVDRPWELPMPGPMSWAALAGLGVLSTALAYVFYFRILAAAGATNILLVTLLVPVSAVLLGTTILGELLDGTEILGAAIIGLALAAIDGRPVAMLRAGMGSGKTAAKPPDTPHR